MTAIEGIKAKGLNAWYVKDKKSEKYISIKYDGNYEFVDEPHMFCMSLDCLLNYLTKPHRTIYSKDSKLNVNIISPLDINDIEIVCK
jgi:hypothetical protein